MNKKTLKGHEPIPANKVEKPKKGKGSYTRKPKHKNPVEDGTMATIVYPDGTSEKRLMTWQMCRDEIGGWIEVLALRNGAIALVDEEGLIKRLRPNRIASIVAELGTILVGTVIFTSKDMLKGGA